MKENSEEDIKNIEEIIELSKEEIDAKDENITAILDIEDLISLEHILSDYKRVLKENEELNSKIPNLEQGTEILMEINTKLTNENEHYEDLICALETYYDITEEDLKECMKNDR